MTRYHDFGPLELKVLGLFTAEDALSAGDVQARLRTGGDELAYTTVMTVLARLADKRALSRRLVRGRALETVCGAARQ